MTTSISPKEKMLFDALRRDKLDDLKTFSKDSNRGMWKTIIDQYPESAHFIYELLQNANDAGATYVKIVISGEGVIFKHNGTVQFTVTPLNTNPVGHINSITSIGDSSKDGLNTIGKFGVGFKSVFSYTDTPEIYDDKFWFRINSYIVPTLLDKDHNERSQGETLFWLPFKSNDQQRCYNEVVKKIRTLDNPILFLDNVKSIEWVDLVCNESSQYSKTIEKSRKFRGIQSELLRVNNSGVRAKIWMFHRNVKIEGIKKQQKISVGYYVNEIDGRDVIDTSADPKVFCYFSTSVKFNQKRIMHAPFLLTASRSELREDKLNDFLKHELAKLSADSLVCLRDIGLQSKLSLINENLLDLVTIPSHYGIYVQKDIWSEEYMRVIKQNALLLSKNGKYISISSAVIVYSDEIRHIISDKQLTVLLGSKEPKYFVYSRVRLERNKLDYLTGVLGVSYFDNKRFANLITSDFMSQQTDGWLHRFYDFLNNSRDWELFKICPIIRTNKGAFVVPYINNSLNVFSASTNVDSEKHIVDAALLKKRRTKDFLKKLGVREIKPLDQIDAIGLKHQQHREMSREELYGDTHYICINYLRSKSADQKKILEKLACKLLVSSECKGGVSIANICDTYDKSSYLDAYFKGNDLDRIKILDYDFYAPLFDEFEKDRVMQLFYKLGLKITPIIASVSKPLCTLPEQIRDEIQRHSASYGFEITDFEMHGLDHALKYNLSKVISLQLWKWLSNALNDGILWNELTYEYYYYTNKKGKTASCMLQLLSTTRWIYVNGKPKNKPNKFSRKQMRDAGYCDNEKLFDILGVKRTWEDSPDIPEDVKQMASIGEQFKGYSTDELDRARVFLEEERQHRLHEELSNEELHDFIHETPVEECDESLSGSSLTSSSSHIRAKEGALKLSLHIEHERSPSVVRRFKQHRFHLDPDLKCEICGFSFRKTYGKLGLGYAEAHHTFPISWRQDSAETTFEDLVVVCSNCHSMLHKKIFGKPLSVDNLKTILSND